MVKGLGAGMLSGGVVGAIVMSGLSLYAPLPQDRIDAAPKLEATQAQPDTAAQAETGTTAEAAEPETSTPATDVPVVTPSDTDASATPTVADEEASIAPEGADTSVETVVATEQAAVVTNEANVETAQTSTNAEAVTATETADNAESETIAAEDTAVAATTQTTPSVVAEVDTATTAEAEDTAASIVGDDADAPRVQASGLNSERIVGEEQVDEAEGSTQTAALAAPKPAPALPRITTPKPATAGEQVSADTPVILPTPKVPGVVTNRLPKVGGTSTPEAAPAAEEVAPEVQEDLGALAQFASPVEGTEGKSLMAFVLIDTGEDGIPRADLASLAIPITIAIDPVMENAAEIMAEYRAAGIEVVAIANDLPVASGPGDVATAVSAYFNVLSQSVALMDPLDARIQSNRSLLQPVLGAIRDSGHGLITYDRGLNTAQQAAQRESIPVATVFRVLDADLEETPKIKRYLDRAAFSANQDGAVVLVGRSYPETVKALVEWSLEKKDASIAVVPVSAVMLAGGS